MNTIGFWLKNARPVALPQSLLPALTMLCFAAGKAGFSLPLALIAVAGVVVGHLAMNLFDDYFDYRLKRTSFRRQLQHRGMRARISKCQYLESGATTLNQLLCACFIFGALSLVAGFIIWSQRGNLVLVLAATTAILGISYSGAPLRLSYHGLGEIVIGLMFGPLLMAGVYFSACGSLDRSALFVSVPVGLLVANIVYTHSIMDYEPDREAGKMTFAVLLKSRNRMLFCLLALLIGAYAGIAWGVIAGFLSVYYLFTLLTIPTAASLFYMMWEFVHHPDRPFTPRFWMGPMGDWVRLQSIGIDWFMIRWLTARNLLAFFCLILILVSLVDL